MVARYGVLSSADDGKIFDWTPYHLNQRASEITVTSSERPVLHGWDACCAVSQLIYFCNRRSDEPLPSMVRLVIPGYEVEELLDERPWPKTTDGLVVPPIVPGTVILPEDESHILSAGEMVIDITAWARGEPGTLWSRARPNVVQDQAAESVVFGDPIGSSLPHRSLEDWITQCCA
ncbi:hypothetical protein [Microvirga puerhi]|uniref:Uncharacterized protein n=1 Tax=Microvirga puerhi TaxID=2876078 RepID=A0ABS7VTN6_9HYPH|nr:hypothetical protein [Microvirga puerhi]MBZ6078920.1 hypothetical protein [Microvirga puerhi]